MSRTRMIKPAFFKHVELYEAERSSGLPLRIAFAGLWTVADREGRFRWKADIKPDILPYDPVDIMLVLDTLERGGFIAGYVVDGKRYGLIPSFKDHQTFHKTERKSSLPAPLANGESTVKYTADTVAVAVAVTGTVAGTVAASNADDDVPLLLARACNAAITAKWGEQTHPVTVAQCQDLANSLVTNAISSAVARASIERQCRDSKLKRPPSSPNYFTAGILEDRDRAAVRGAIASTRDVPSSDAPLANGQAIFAKICGMIQRPTTGRPFIPKTEVAKLGAAALRAYESIGGADRVIALADEAKQRGFLLREFENAYVTALKEAA